LYELGEEEKVTSERLATSLRVHPLVARLLVRRGICDTETAGRYLHPKLVDLHDPALLPGIDACVEKLLDAIRRGRSIVIYGDYDVDGITASSILWHMMQWCGAKVTTYTPHRLEEGYGLNRSALESFCDSGREAPVVISVDCGVTACDEAQFARSLGIDLIITDHHEFDVDQPPEACAVVHPRWPGSQYPFGMLCGAGVALKVAWALARAHCGTTRLPDPCRLLLLDLLSLASLGTVADVVPLVDENRALTSYGLGHIKGTSIAGLNALIDASNLRDEKISAYHVGFVLGPRLNACGRMGHAGRAVHLLTEAGAEEAAEIAKFLKEQNDQRRTIERRMHEEACQKIESAGYDDEACRVIVLEDGGWHAGVLGIVASRLTEKFHRPVVMLSVEDGRVQGSARSVAGVSILEAFASCEPLLDNFGGHAMAAGVRFRAENIGAFRDGLLKYVNERLAPDDLVATVNIDAICALRELEIPLLDEIERLAPFGRDNPAPVLAVVGVRLDGPPKRVGADGSHLRVLLRDGTAGHAAIGFGLGDLAPNFASGDRVDVAFEPKTSRWQGRRQMELRIKAIRKTEG